MVQSRSHQASRWALEGVVQRGPGRPDLDLRRRGLAGDGAEALRRHPGHRAAGRGERRPGGCPGPRSARPSRRRGAAGRPPSRARARPGRRSPRRKVPCQASWPAGSCSSTSRPVPSLDRRGRAARPRRRSARRRTGPAAAAPGSPRARPRTRGVARTDRGERPGELLRHLVGLTPGDHGRSVRRSGPPAGEARRRTVAAARRRAYPQRRVAAVLALLSSVLWGSADFLGGTMSRRRRAALRGRGLPGRRAAGDRAWWPWRPARSATTAGYLPWAVLPASPGWWAWSASTRRWPPGTMGVVSPIAALGVVVPWSSGWPRASDRRPLQLVGIVVAVAGVVLASGPELSGRAGARPVLLAGGGGRGLRRGAAGDRGGQPAQHADDAGDDAASPR